MLTLAILFMNAAVNANGFKITKLANHLGQIIDTFSRNFLIPHADQKPRELRQFRLASCLFITKQLDLRSTPGFGVLHGQYQGEKLPFLVRWSEIHLCPLSHSRGHLFIEIQVSPVAFIIKS